jgi:hypothetical protein
MDSGPSSWRGEDDLGALDKSWEPDTALGMKGMS